MDVDLPQELLIAMNARRHSPSARPSSAGFALMVTTVLLAVVIAVSFTLLDVSLSMQRTSKTIERTYDATLLAEAGVQKAVFCLKAADGARCGGAFGPSYAGESNVGFGTGSFSVAVAGTGPTRTITSTGTTAGGYTQTVVTQASVEAPSEAQPGFDYAVQAADLGVELQNNAAIDNGVVYTNSDVVCGNNAEVNYDIYVSKPGGKIDNCTGVIDAHADNVLRSKVLADAYYKTDPSGVAGSTVSGTKRPNQATPAAQGMPPFDKVFWENVAESGGVIYGDYSPADGTVLGPVKIAGNLTIANNVAVTLNGPVWVAGNVTIGNNASVSLAAGFGASSGVIIADDPGDTANGGLIDISNNAAISGSGTDGSYVLMYSANTRTADASPAIKVANNAAGGIFYAPDGAVRIYNNGSAVAAVARRVYLDNNATIAYDNAGTTPSSMTIAKVAGGVWRFLQGAWHQFK